MLLIGLAGLTLVPLAIYSMNLAALAFAVTFLVGAIVRYDGFERASTRWLASVPFALLLGALFGSGFALAGHSAAMLPVFMVHF